MMNKIVSKIIRKSGRHLYEMSEKIQKDPDILLSQKLCKNCQGRGWYVGPDKYIGDAAYGEQECEDCNGDGYT